MFGAWVWGHFEDVGLLATEASLVTAEAPSGADLEWQSVWPASARDGDPR